MLFIFDWDGTLCNSLDRIILSAQRAAVDCDLEEPAASQVQSIVGLGLAEALQRLFPHLSEQQYQPLVGRYKHHFLNLAEEVPSPLYKDALHTLESLRTADHQLAVATGKSRMGLDLVLRELGMQNYFDATRCADETKSKPHPMMLHELLVELDHPAEQALMIGDTDFDLQMARSAGIRAVGVTYGAHSRERLEQSDPHLLVDDLVSILEYF
jgi:phosphoglycolate phosphatase